MERIGKNRGITLISLVVTVAVILILSGITVYLVIGNGGLIGKSFSAKEGAEIESEKGIIERAVLASSVIDEDFGVDTLEYYLEKEAGKNKVEVSEYGHTFEIAFVEKNRFYSVDENNIVGDAQYITSVEKPGDITKGGRCDGTEEKPYEISCIEDLVAFSNMVNGTGIKFENGEAISITSSNAFSEKYVVLTRSLNFKSKYSYADSTRTDFGNLNGDDTDGNSLITDMTTGTGFIPIGYNSRYFNGNFDGKGHTIENIWINIEEQKNAGLFGYISGNASIKNLTVTGKIKSNWHTGGIAGNARIDSNCSIVNCVNKADVTGYNMVGGIAGCFIKNIEDCKNYGTITITGGYYSYGGAGGITAYITNAADINNCINYGEVKGEYQLGGIAGIGSSCNITNCKNIGSVTCLNSSRVIGGILAEIQRGGISILNCSNTGTISGQNSTGGIIGRVRGGDLTIEINTNINNCYNMGKVISTDGDAGGIIGEQGILCSKNYINIKNTYNMGDINGKRMGKIMGIIYYSTNTETKTEFENVYYTLEPAIGSGSLTSGEATLKTEADIQSQSFVDLLNTNIADNADCKKWKLGQDGTPTFVD